MLTAHFRFFAVSLLISTPSLDLCWAESNLAADTRPNIVWIVVDDMSCHFGYQGETLARTPNVDRLAKEGTVFTHAYATAPVCSTFRSAMITGMYQTTIGSHHHRSGRGELSIELPNGVQTVPEIFKAAGYYTCIADARTEKKGKQDYNFSYDQNQLYDGIDYRKRKNGQPFFAQYHLRGGKLRNVETWYKETVEGLQGKVVDRKLIELPPYYPEHPVIVEDWAQYLDSVNYTDIEVGRIVQRLKSDGVLNNTVIFFLTDHGISHARGKQFLYEEGIHIPLIMWSPQREGQPQVRDNFVAHIDLAATSLELAHIPIPKWMQGRSFLDDNTNPRQFVISARDRCDETVDRIRSVRMGDWKYIHNTYPNRPYLQPSNYKDSKPFMPILRELHESGKLNVAQSLQMRTTRPQEELYHLPTDPWELNNLAGLTDHAGTLLQLRKTLSQWETSSNDQGRIPESEAMYDSDMDAVLKKMRTKNPEAFQEYQENISLMKLWQSQGK